MNPLVSVIVPTYQAETTIAQCVRAVRTQDYHNYEILVIDSLSRDSTRQLAISSGARVFATQYRLLGARIMGLRMSKGDVVLMLDADQILEPNVLSRVVSLMNSFDMICLGEISALSKHWLEILFQADRRLVHSSPDYMDPLTGVVLPRVFRRRILESAVSRISERLFSIAIAHDHAIIYYEAARESARIGSLPKAIRHLEPSSALNLVRKNYRYGFSTGALLKSGFYHQLIASKTRPRVKGIRKRNIKDALAANSLLALKTGPYLGGFLVGYMTS